MKFREAWELLTEGATITNVSSLGQVPEVDFDMKESFLDDLKKWRDSLLNARSDDEQDIAFDRLKTNLQRTLRNVDWRVIVYIGSLRHETGYLVIEGHGFDMDLLAVIVEPEAKIESADIILSDMDI